MPHSSYLPERMGTAEISPTGKFEAGSFQSFTLVYTAGYFGIDDTGSIKIVHRFASDMGGRNGAIRRRRTTPRSRPRTARCSKCSTIPSSTSGRGTRPCSSGSCAAFCAKATRSPCVSATRARARPACACRPSSSRPSSSASWSMPFATCNYVELPDAADDLDRCRPAGDLEGGPAHAARLRRGVSASASRARTNGATPATRSRAGSRCVPITRSADCRRAFRCSAASTPNRSRACRLPSRETC